eukprot:GFKZ01013804.1.p1 GENE.GFKZ01013804.1~~GFKZ01013804.1.p1  ORF type:complete len:198 (-),score=6.19 GFKZ01013804.1:1456-1989(-)
MEISIVSAIPLTTFPLTVRSPNTSKPPAPILNVPALTPTTARAPVETNSTPHSPRINHFAHALKSTATTTRKEPNHARTEMQLAAPSTKTTAALLPPPRPVPPAVADPAPHKPKTLPSAPATALIQVGAATLRRARARTMAATAATNDWVAPSANFDLGQMPPFFPPTLFADTNQLP